MSNNYYTHGSFPSQGSAATSGSMRAELDLITAGFDKLPTLTGNASKLVAVNGSGSALVAINTLPALSVLDADFTFLDNDDQTKAFKFDGSAITAGQTRTYTMPDADATLVGLATTQTLTNKTISGANNTLSNIGNSSLTNSSITINGNTVALGGSTTVTATASQALTIGTGLSGTSYDGSSAVTIAINSSVVTLTGTQTLTNKTLTSPTVNTPAVSNGTFSAPAISNGSISGTTIDNAVIGGTTPAAGTFTTFTATADSSFTSTGALLISKGTTAQQPAGAVAGMMRYNTSTHQFEGYSGSTPAWKSIGGSALSNDTATSSFLYPVFAGATSGTAENLYTGDSKLLYKPATGELKSTMLNSSNGVQLLGSTIAEDVTIPAGSNGFSVSPVTIASGKSVTIASGQRWFIA